MIVYDLFGQLKLLVVFFRAYLGLLMTIIRVGYIRGGFRFLKHQGLSLEGGNLFFNAL